MKDLPLMKTTLFNQTPNRQGNINDMISITTIMIWNFRNVIKINKITKSILKVL